ncbi:hypothetical protein L2E82_32043 [Cichorium intybus]|uniref:Uncharacterized protein n=1 Tax=Cichorium intybus TaxID=13427 RepID=A0ACB9BFQ5_CICIN|nr:hypothetical protein L2E82_32043 [Cichorium intybus]
MGGCFSKKSRHTSNSNGYGSSKQQNYQPVSESYEKPTSNYNQPQHETHQYHNYHQQQPPPPPPQQTAPPPPNPRPSQGSDPNTILGKPFEDIRRHYTLGKELGRGSKGEENAAGDTLGQLGKGGAILMDLAPSPESFIDKPPNTVVHSGGTKGAYVPPSMRGGAERPAGSDMRRRNEETLSELLTSLKTLANLICLAFKNIKFFWGIQDAYQAPPFQTSPYTPLPTSTFASNDNDMDSTVVDPGPQKEPAISAVPIEDGKPFISMRELLSELKNVDEDSPTAVATPSHSEKMDAQNPEKQMDAHGGDKAHVNGYNRKEVSILHVGHLFMLLFL